MDFNQLFNEVNSGYYGSYGGAFIPEILQTSITQLEKLFNELKKAPSFIEEYESVLRDYTCYPTPISYLSNLSEFLGGAKIFVKREDLNQTGSHKLNNVIGQGLLTKRLNKSRVIAETGAGQHGFATATMAARLGLKCRIYMGSLDVERQRSNVFWMEQLGAEVIAVEEGQKTLKDAINEALRDWVNFMEDTNYIFGTACGPHPFPEIVSFFQSFIGKNAYEQMQKIVGKVPEKIFACVGGGSNAIGLFSGFLNEKSQLIACEAGGKSNILGEHASRLSCKEATVGVAHGYKSYFLQDGDGNMLPTSSISAGLNYIGVSPILAYLHDKGRVESRSVRDSEVIESLKMLIEKEGLIPALESSHAFVEAIKDAPKMSKDEIILVNMSGRGDKDIFTIAEALNDKKWKEFIKKKSRDYE